MSGQLAFTVFASSIGECALAWSDRGICAVWLPEHRPGGVRARIRRRWPTAVECDRDAGIGAAVTQLRKLLVGEPEDLRGLCVDLMLASDFARAVYAVAREIPAGRVLTYAGVAERIGNTATAQAVGQALGANPVPLIVPCHRVIAAHGRLGGFSAPGGSALKRRLLTLENARLDGPPGLFDDAPQDASGGTSPDATVSPSPALIEVSGRS